ncbi:MAG TPA: nitroreductase family protein [Thermoanaerobaculia bacterium]|nr:nitroreductase family protein [Thermoanaerobaculia bacterium]HUM31297.1 nitroreductase family protein [Thermoanaerobaculia bacterium]HXK69651.1 nitroreductase family protein [Thermoanaerobaculia bacterium]
MNREAPTDISLLPAIRKRWSPRSFSRDPIQDKILLSLFEAARWSPSSFNEQPWRFILARQTDPEAFTRMADCLMDANRVWASHAPILMVALARTRFSHNEKENRHARHDLGMALENLAIQAADSGLMVHFMGGFSRDAVVAEWAVPPEFEPVTMAALGYPGDPSTLSDSLQKAETAPRIRNPLSSLVFEGAWGRPGGFLPRS